MAHKLTKQQRAALEVLRHGLWQGNYVAHPVVLRNLLAAGLIECKWVDYLIHYKWRITEQGKRALQR